MKVTPIKTRALLPPQDDLLAVIDEADFSLKNGSVLAVSAKVLAIHQGRTVPVPQDEEEFRREKDALIKREAEWYTERDLSVPFPRIFTIYEGTLCSSAGIDESNGNGYWVLLPEESEVFAAELRKELCRKHGISELGIIVTDSRSYPMRQGTIGITLGHAGFEAEFDYRGNTDIFGKTFVSERMNVADCLASVALLAMGEGDESTPLAVIEDISHIVFTENDTPEDNFLALKTTMEQDVFTQFYRSHEWKKGGKHRS